MGIFDFLQPSAASQQPVQQATLFDLLRRSAMAQQPTFGGANVDQQQAQYAPQVPQQVAAQAPAQVSQANQPSPLDTAQWPFGPVGAPSQAMAQMPAPQSAPQPVAQPQISTPGIGDHLAAGAQSFAGSGGKIIPSLLNGFAGLLTGQRADPAGKAQNVTAQALLAKGVDPQTVSAAASNPDLMKTLITQTFGPQTVQSLGNGYIADKNGKITRAYEPDDKTPPGFQKTDNGLQPIPGGPADLNYLRAKAVKEKDPNAVHVLGNGGELYRTDENGNPVIVHKNQPNADATLDDKTTEKMADQYLAGDRSVLQNLGRGAQGAANIIKLRQAISSRADAAGVDPKGIVNNFNEQAGALAGQRAVGTRAANISLAANEANNMIPIALDASDKLPRSQYMPWNQMVQTVQKGSSSPELASFVAATNSLVNSYVRAVSPSGVPTDSMRQHAYDMLNAAQGPEAYKAVINTMKLEMGAALSAPSQVRKELRGESEQHGSLPKIDDLLKKYGGS